MGREKDLDLYITEGTDQEEVSLGGEQSNADGGAENVEEKKPNVEETPEDGGAGQGEGSDGEGEKPEVSDGGAGNNMDENNDGEKPSEGEDAADGGENQDQTDGELDGISGDNLKKMLDALDDEGEKQEENIDKANEATQEVKEAVKDNPELLSKISDLEAELNKITLSNEKTQKTNEILKSEYDKVLAENIQFKYGNSSEGAIAQLVDTDPSMKNIVAAAMKAKDGGEEGKAEYVNALKSELESLTGVKFDEYVKTTKEQEADSMSEPDTSGAIDEANNKESLYI